MVKQIIDTETLDEGLPSAKLMASALAYELGIAWARGIWEDYPEGYNRELPLLAERFRDWLVNPPKGQYSFTA